MILFDPRVRLREGSMFEQIIGSAVLFAVGTVLFGLVKGYFSSPPPLESPEDLRRKTTFHQAEDAAAKARWEKKSGNGRS